MKYFKKLVGEKLYLSPMNIEDAEKYVEWLNNKEVAMYIYADRKVNSVESEKAWLENMLKNQEQSFAIVDIDNDKLIGNCSFVKMNNIDQTATIGIFIGDSNYHSKGYGHEALKLLLNYGFNTLNLNNIDLDVLSFNERAINCYKKVGFKEYGRRHECYFSNGKYYDSISMEILRKNFK